MLRSASGDPWTSPRVVAGHASCTGHTTKFAQQRALFYSPARKFAQRNPFTGTFAKKLAQHATNRRFWAIFRALGELFRAFAHHQAKQGELYPARRATSGTKLSQHTDPTGNTGTELSQHARLGGPPGTKLSQHAPKRRFRPILRQQGELCTVSATNTTSRANFIPHAEPLPVQNSPSTHPRRAQPVQNSPCRPARRPTRYRTLPARPARRPTRYKTRLARPKTPISGHFSHAGRTFYRFRHQHDEQGEKSHAPTLHRTPTTCRSPNFACNSIA